MSTPNKRISPPDQDNQNPSNEAKRARIADVAIVNDEDPADITVPRPENVPESSTGRYDTFEILKASPILDLWKGSSEASGSVSQRAEEPVPEIQTLTAHLLSPMPQQTNQEPDLDLKLSQGSKQDE